MQEPRFDTRIPTRFELGDQAAEGCIQNAGPGGVFIHTSEMPERGEKVWISFEGPGGETVEASGIVWWTSREVQGAAPEKRGFGVRLVASSGDYRKLLEKLARG